MTEGHDTEEPKEGGHAGAAAASPPELPHDPPPAEAAAPARPPRPRIWWVAALVVLVVLLVASASFWAPLLPWAEQGDGGAQTAALDSRIAALETARQADARRLAQLEQAPAPQPSASLAALGDRVAALERSPAAAPAPDIAGDLAPLKDEIRQLSARLDAAETRLQAADGRIGTLSQAAASGAPADPILLLGVMELRSAAASSGPFAGELAAAEALARDRPQILAAMTPLEPVAATGLPSVAALAERFGKEVAPALQHDAAAAPDPDAGLGPRILARIESLVVIHRVDGNGGSRDPVARAQAALAKRDLAGAVDALGALPAQDAAAGSWLDAARQRLAVEKTLSGLVQQATADLAQAAAAPAPAETR